MAKTDYRRGDLSGMGGFVPLPYSVLDSAAYLSLGPSAVKLLFDVYRQYSGKNNGSLSPCWELMQKRGWKSPNTLSNAKKELRASRLITVTRQGTKGVNGTAELWAVNWLSLDWRSDFDIDPKGHDHMGYVDLKINPDVEQDQRKLRLVQTALKAAKKIA